MPAPSLHRRYRRSACIIKAWWIAVFSIAVLPCAARSGSPVEAGRELIDAQDLQHFVDGVVGHSMRRDHIAGVAVAIVQGGRPILVKGYGYADFSPARPVDPQRTLFRVGSVSKTFTWTLLMQQVENGRVKLDATVNSYLTDELKIPDAGFERPILVRDLMAHAAGFEEKEFGVSRVADPGAFIPLRSYLQRHRPDLVHAAGALPTYSNYGVSLIGPVLTGLLGGDYETLAEKHLIGPLGLQHTTFRQPYTPKPGLAAPMPTTLREKVSGGYTWANGRFRREAFEILETVPAGSVSTTAADMARYMLLHLAEGSLDDKHFYGPAAARAFRTPVLATPAGVNGWAHGFAVTPLPGGFTGYGHGGTTLIFYTNMVLVPELDLGIFVTANTNTARALRDHFAAQIVEHFYAAGPKSLRAGDPHFTAQAHLYEGRYVTTRRAYSGLQKFLSLMQPVEVMATHDGYLLTSGGSTVQRWALDPARKGVFHAVDNVEQLTFTFDDDGRAVSWPHPNGTGVYERVSALYSPTFLARTTQLALLSAFLIGVLAIARWRQLRSATREQRLSTALVLAAGACWLLAWACYDAASDDMADMTTFFYAWPSGAVLLSSSAALLATVLSAFSLFAVLFAFRSRGAGTHSRSSGGGLAVNSFATVVYLALAIQLGARGALLPWLS